MTNCKGKPKDKCKPPKCKFVKTKKREYCRSKKKKTRKTPNKSTPNKSTTNKSKTHSKTHGKTSNKTIKIDNKSQILKSKTIKSQLKSYKSIKHIKSNMASTTLKPPSTNVFVFDTLYGKDKHGKIKEWKASIHEDPETTNAIAVIQFGYKDGKQQQTKRVYTEGKNIGKKNETSKFKQALNETNRKWLNKKEKEAYTTNLDELTTTQTKSNNTHTNNSTNPTNANTTHPKIHHPPYFPMLAKTYKPTEAKKKDIEYPCFVQPKLDGVRCMAYIDRDPTQSTQTILQSRKGIPFPFLQHIKDELAEIYKTNTYLQENPETILDGELYSTTIPFEELVGLIRKKKPTPKDVEKMKTNIQLYIYDCITTNPKDTFETRLDIINSFFSTKNITGPIYHQHIKLTPTYIVNSKEEFYKYFQEFIQDGFEGIMLRNIDGLYKEKYRSNDLQKYKEFFEDEYKIVGFEEGKGKDANTIIFVCETPEGNRFNVRPRGSYEYRKELFEKGPTLIGKMLTVIYQELTNKKTPRFGVGKAIRDIY